MKLPSLVVVYLHLQEGVQLALLGANCQVGLDCTLMVGVKLRFKVVADSASRVAVKLASLGASWD